jgi:hypothetical protein
VSEADSRGGKLFVEPDAARSIEVVLFVAAREEGGRERNLLATARELERREMRAIVAVVDLAAGLESVLARAVGAKASLLRSPQTARLS